MFQMSGLEFAGMGVMREEMKASGTPRTESVPFASDGLEDDDRDLPVGRFAIAVEPTVATEK